jgi:hypothetical protein
LAKFFLLAESKALVEIFLKMKSKLIFDGPIFFYTRLFFGGLQVRPTVYYDMVEQRIADGSCVWNAPG